MKMTKNIPSRISNGLLLFFLFGLLSCQHEATLTRPSSQKRNQTASEIPNVEAIRSLFNSLQPAHSKEELNNLIKSELSAYRQNLKPFKSRTFNRDQLLYTYLGLSIKGSGGGGAFTDGVRIMSEIFNRTDQVEVYDVSTVEDDKLYVVAGGIGAPSALRNNLDGLVEAIKSSIFTLADAKNQPLGGILSVESGSVNAAIAILLSVELGVPLIDADGAGRAVPKLSNLTYAHESYAIAPTVLTSAPSPGSAVEILHPTSPDNAEELIRKTISKPEFGQMGGLALWAQSGRELKASSIVENTYSEAYELGVYTLLSMFYSPSILDMYFERKNTLISAYDGTLENFEVKTKGGFDVTTLTIRLSDGSAANIYALNENLFMKTNSGTVITAPHLLSYMVQLPPPDNSYYPINNGDVALMKSAVGRKIHVVASYAAKRLYDFDNTFLDILKQVFQYDGPVSPPPPSSQY